MSNAGLSISNEYVDRGGTVGNGSGSSKVRRYVKLEAWGVRFSALLTALMGIINVTSAVQPALQNRLAIIEEIFPLEVRHSTRIVAALAGFALLLLAGALWRRKHIAWLLTLGLLVLSIL